MSMFNFLGSARGVKGIGIFGIREGKVSSRKAGLVAVAVQAWTLEPACIYIFSYSKLSNFLLFFGLPFSVLP